MSDQFFKLDEYAELYLAEMALAQDMPLVLAVIKVVDTIDSIKDLISTRVYNVNYNHQSLVVKKVQPYEAYITLAMQDYKFEYLPHYIGWFVHKDHSYLICQHVDMVSLIQTVRFCDEAFILVLVRKVIRWLIKYNNQYNFVHRDLPDNVFISTNTYEPVIIDFEYSSLQSATPASWTRDAVRLITRINALRPSKQLVLWLNQINTDPEEFIKLNTI